MRHLLEEPVLGRIALADGVGDVVGEEAGIAQRPSPQPVVGAIALEELVCGAVGIADLPELFAIADRLPVEFAEVQGFCLLRRSPSRSVIFTEDSIGKGAQNVGAGPHIGDGESAISRAVHPELVVVSVMRPGYDVAVPWPVSGTQFRFLCSLRE